MDPFKIAKRIFDVLRAYKREALTDWDISSGPPIYVERYELNQGIENGRGAILGGFQCHVRGTSYAGRVMVYLMENGTYAVETGAEYREGIPEKALGETLDNLIMGKIGRA